MLSFCFTTIVLAAAQPSEDYLAAARAAYVLPEVAAIRRNLTEEKMDENEPVT